MGGEKEKQEPKMVTPVIKHRIYFFVWYPGMIWRIMQILEGVILIQ